MKFLRTITEKNMKDTIKTTDIRGKLKMEEIQNQIKESKPRWYGHVKRMDEHTQHQRDYWK